MRLLLAPSPAAATAKAVQPLRRRRRHCCSPGALAATSAAIVVGAAAAFGRSFLLVAPVWLQRRAQISSVGRADADGQFERHRTARHAEVAEKSKERLQIKPVQPISWMEKPRPPTLPVDLFKPKESLSQNFLADPNLIFKMVAAVEDRSPNGKRVVELGPGTGALTTRLFKKYPEMVAIELDQRAMRVLAEKVPGCTVVRSDVLLVNYTMLSEIRGGRLNVVGNLPYHITSQILFGLLDHNNVMDTALFTMTKDVAKRICARPRTKEYGIPSIIFQLYTDVRIMFHLSPKAFFPRPNTISSYVKFDFESARERREALNVDPRDLRNLTKTAFQQRNKRLGSSLKYLLRCHTTLIDRLPEEYEKMSPSDLEPWEFVHLSQLMFGKKPFPKHFRFAFRGEFGRSVKNKDYDYTRVLRDGIEEEEIDFGEDDEDEENEGNEEDEFKYNDGADDQDDEDM